jgi:hypothetical protein
MMALMFMLTVNIPHKAQRLSWFGHIKRLPDTKTIKKICNWKPLTKRAQGRPKYRWEDNITQDICLMKIKKWIACVQDRGKWKEVFENAKSFNHEVQCLEEEEEVNIPQIIKITKARVLV